MNRKSVLLRAFLTTVILTALVVAVAFLGLLAAGALESRLSDLRRELVGELERAIAQELSWESVNPSVLRGLTVHGVRVSGGVGYADSVSIALDPASLLRGDTLHLVPRVTIRRPYVEISTREELARLEQTINFLRKTGQGRRTISVFVRDGEGSITTDHGTLRVDRAETEVHLSATRISSRLQGNFELETVLEDEPFTMTTTLTAVADADRRGDPVGVTLSLERISGSHLTLTDQAFRIERSGNEVLLERIRSQDAFDLTARLDLSREEIHLTADSHSLVPGSLVRFHGPWTRYNEWITEPVTTSSEATATLQGDLLEARGTLDTTVVHDDVPEPFRFRAEYAYRPGTIEFPSLTVWTLSGSRTPGSARFSGSWNQGTIAPDGTIRFSRFSYAGSPVLNGPITVSGSSDTIGVGAPEVTVDGVPLYELSALFRLGEQRHSLEVSATLEEDGRSRIRVESRFVDDTDFTGKVEVTDLSLEHALAAAAIPGYAFALPEYPGTLRADGTIRFDRRSGETVLRVAYLALRDEERPERLAMIAGDYRDGAVLITSLYIQDENVTLVGKASGFVYSDGGFSFSTDFRLNHVEYSLEGTYTSDGTLVLSGPYQFRAVVRRTPSGGVSVSARGREIPLPLGRAVVSLDADGVFFDRDNWYLNLQDVRARSFPLPRGRVASATAAVSLRPGIVQVAVVELTDGFSPLAGTINITYQWDQGVPEVVLNGTLRGIETEEQYRIVARYLDGGYAVDLRLAASPAVRFSDRVDRGSVSGTIQAAGTLQDPEVRLFLESERLIIDGTGASFSFLAQSNASVVRLSQVEVAFGPARLDVPGIVLDRDSGELEGVLTVTRPQREFSMVISGTTDPLPRFSPDVLGTLSADVFLRATPGSTGITRESTRDEIADPRAWEYRLTRIAGETRLERQDGFVRANLSDEGEFDLHFGGDLPYRGQATGLVTPERVEITVTDIAVDLGRLPLPSGMDEFLIDQGTVRGSLRVIGAPGDPDLYGTLSIQSLRATTLFSPDPVGPLDAALIFEEKLVRLQQTAGPVGKATLIVSARMLLSRLTLEQFELDLAIPGETGIHLASEFGPVTVDGFGRGSLRVAGTADEFSVSGDVTVYGAELAVTVEEEMQITGGPNAVLDLVVRTGRAVRFIWPDTELPILRANFATGQRLDLQVDAREETFSLTGDLDIQSGDIFYFDRNFLIRNGRVVFRESQDDFDPRLTARAELREATPEGPVRIYLIADGQRLSEFSPRFEANPPLENAEIVAILGGSILQTAGDGPVSLTSALLSTSGIVTQFAFFRQFENAVREQLDLDLFAVRTSLIQNMLLSAITPADEEIPQELTPSLGNYLHNTSVFLGRYIGDDVFGQMVLQMRSRDPEFFVEDDGIQRIGGVLIDSEFSLEWQTPFFLLEWNFAPQNPEELFIRDNTFSFLWSFSY
jgi:translocation and assembly module TamB